MGNSFTVTKEKLLEAKILSQFNDGILSRAEAAKKLECSEKTVTRNAKKLRNQDIPVLIHGNAGKIPHNKSQQIALERAFKAKRELYFDYNMRHAWEVLRAKDEMPVAYSTWAAQCALRGLGKHRKRRAAAKARHRRERASQSGLLVQFDGSFHRWNGATEWCLIAAVDDATSECIFAQFYEGETTLSCLDAIKQISRRKGLPHTLYTDTAALYGKNERVEFSHFSAACDSLGISIIPTVSPQSKGRIERSFRTFQDRLIPELRSAGIRTMDRANQYLNDVFLPLYWNKKLTVAARQTPDAYRKLAPGVDLDLTCAIVHRRKAAPDNTISYGGETYQLFPKVAGYRFSLKNLQVEIRIQSDSVVRYFAQGMELKAVKWVSPKKQAARGA